MPARRRMLNEWGEELPDPERPPARQRRVYGPAWSTSRPCSTPPSGGPPEETRGREAMRITAVKYRLSPITPITRPRAAISYVPNRWAAPRRSRQRSAVTGGQSGSTCHCPLPITFFLASTDPVAPSCNQIAWELGGRNMKFIAFSFRMRRIAP